MSESESMLAEKVAASADKEVEDITNLDIDRLIARLITLRASVKQVATPYEPKPRKYSDLTDTEKAEKRRAKSREYYAKNRDSILQKERASRAKKREESKSEALDTFRILF